MGNSSTWLLFLLPKLAKVFIIIFVIIIAKVAAITIYRLWWHPLAKYPGPRFAKISNWYAAYHAYKGDMHKDIYRAHQRYGSIIRYGPDRLIFARVEAMNSIYHAKSVRKSKAYTALLPWPGAWNIHNTIDKSVSQRKRKLISQWLSEDRLKRFESIIVRESGAFVNKFRDSRDSSDDWSKPVNVSDCCRFLIFDIMSECCFGKSFNLQTNPANRYLVHFANPLHRFNSAFVQSLDLMKYHLEKLFYPQGLWYAWKISKLARGMYTEQQSDKAGESLLSLLCQVEDPDTGKRMDMTEIWSELRFFMVTGAGSPASALASILFYLMRNVNCYHRLVKEIRSTFSAVSEIYSGSKMASCYYLHACITESLRMSPPVGGILWREVEEGGINIDGEYVSQGYDVGTGIYAVHHNEADFPSPFMFKPERWLQDETENSVGTESKAFLTFSTGPRQCMGRSFSMMILCDVIALLLWQLDLRRPAGGQDDVGGDGEGTVDENEFQQKDHIVSFFDGPCIEFRKRLF